MSANDLSTHDRILETSLKLFNEHGFNNVPALRIAQELGISPGNLAYHFKAKDDIVMALFPRIEEDLNRDIWETRKPRTLTPRVAALQQIEVFRSLWRYRFVFNAMTRMMSGSDELRARYARLQDNILAAIYGIFDVLIERGEMRPIPPPNSTRLIARSIFMVYLGWMRFEQIENPARENARNAAIQNGIMQNFSILQPYLPESFAAEMLAEVRKALPDDQSARPSSRKAAGNAPRAALRQQR